VARAGGIRIRLTSVRPQTPYSVEPRQDMIEWDCFAMQERKRCPWVPLDDPLYVAYHDTEWGVPVHDDRKLFELLILEGFQAGLSWRTVLHKRENFRRAFDGFDPRAVAGYLDGKVQLLLADAGIIRNRLKVQGAVRNAYSFLRVQEEFGTFDRYIWGFVEGCPVKNVLRAMEDYPASTPLSDRLSRDLKARGFTFVGTTVCYAHMQATGMVNDHTVDCFRYGEVHGGADRSIPSKVPGFIDNRQNII